MSSSENYVSNVVAQKVRQTSVQYVSDIGYCFVFEREFKCFELQIIGKNILRLERTDDGSVTDEIYANLAGNFSDEEQNNLLFKFEDAGIPYVMMYSKDHPRKYVYVVVSMTMEAAEAWADLHHFSVPINAREAIIIGRSFDEFHLAKRTCLEDGRDPSTFDIDIGDEQILTYDKLQLKCWEDIHIPFDLEMKVRTESIYAHHHSNSNHGCIIHSRFFLRILNDMITNDHRNGGMKYQYKKYISDGNHPLLHSFALNSDILLRPTMISWWKPMSPSAMSEMVDKEIREYYGESIGFYFAFLLHYSKWLYPMAILGCFWFIVQLSVGKIAVYGSSIIMLIAIFWGVFMIEHYYRREWKLRFKWGMLRFAATDMPRPTFHGSFQVSKADGSIQEIYNAVYIHVAKIFFSLSTMFLCIAVVIAAVVAIWILKTKLGSNEYYSVLIGFINAIQIQIMNVLYTKLADILNEWEQHRLQEEFYNHLVIKRVIFIVVNSFNSLFYIAFWQEYDSDEDRLDALRIQLITLFLSAILIQNMVEIGIPYLLEFVSEKRAEKAAAEYEEYAHKHTALMDDEEEAKESDVHVIVGMRYDSQQSISDQALADIEDQIEKSGEQFDVLANTAEIVVLHGYTILFVVIFPIMPLLALINNYVELRVDLYNLLNGQRPTPEGATGIGVWKAVLSSFNVLAVFSNMALICFRTPLIIDLMDDNEKSHILIFFFAGCLVILFAIFAIRVSVDDQTQSTKESIIRQNNVEKYLLLETQKNIVRMSSQSLPAQPK